MSTAIPQELKDGLKKARARLSVEYTDGEEVMNKIETTLRKKLRAAEFMKNDGAKAMIKDAKQRIEDINLLLTINEDLTEKERSELFAERRVHNFYLARLGFNANKFIESAQDFVNRHLSTDDATT